MTEVNIKINKKNKEVTFIVPKGIVKTVHTDNFNKDCIGLLEDYYLGEYLGSSFKKVKNNISYIK